MASRTDYDAPRTPTDEHENLEELQARKAAGNPATVDVDDAELAETFELPGAEIDEELTVTVIPMQADEFRCSRCFLVRHRTQRAADGKDICVDCA